MDKLLPCPFCGGSAEIICTQIINIRDEFSKSFIIRCANCGTQKTKPFRVYARISNDANCSFDESERLNAIEAWNKRETHV